MNSGPLFLDNILEILRKIKKVVSPYLRNLEKKPVLPMRNRRTGIWCMDKTVETF